MRDDIRAMGDTIIRAVKEHVAASISPLLSRMTALEEQWKARPAPEKGERGKDADPALVAAMVSEAVTKAVAALPPAKNGKDADEAMILAHVESCIERRVALLPKPHDGKDADMGALTETLRINVENAIAALPKPKNGKDADEAAIIAHLEAHLAKLVSSLPKPRDGADADMAELRQVAIVEIKRLFDAMPRPKDVHPAEIREMVREAVDAIPRPKDGRSVEPEAVMRMVTDAIAVMPKPKDGEDGDPGRDALTLDILPGIDAARSYERGVYARHAGGLWRAVANTQGMRGWECIVNGIMSIKIEQDSERDFSVRATQSDGTEAVAHFTMATPLDRGVYDAGVEYAKGDGVTYAGSWWIAQVDKPTAVPGSAEAAGQWRLAVKRGRDGKDVVRVESGDRPVGVVKVK